MARATYDDPTVQVHTSSSLQGLFETRGCPFCKKTWQRGIRSFSRKVRGQGVFREGNDGHHFDGHFRARVPGAWCSHFFIFCRLTQILWPAAMPKTLGASRSSSASYGSYGNCGHGHSDHDGVGHVSFDQLEDEVEDEENLKPIRNSFSSWTEPPDDSNDSSPSAREFEPNRLTHEMYTIDLARFMKIVKYKQPEFRQLVKLRRRNSGFQEEPTILMAIGSLCTCLSEAFFSKSIETQPKQVEKLALLKRIDHTRWMI